MHHFLVPAVLLTCYHNAVGNREKLAERLDVAEKRAARGLGGFCGFYGNCGAAVGTGIFISIVTGETPLTVNSWRQANMMTARALKAIAAKGGPRCCKRNTYLALGEAVDLVRIELGITLEKSEVKCRFSEYNRECKGEECGFYRGAG